MYARARQPSPVAASPGSPWSPARGGPLFSAVSSTCLPPIIVHTVLAAALAIPLAAAPACRIAFVTRSLCVSCSSDYRLDRSLDLSLQRVLVTLSLQIRLELVSLP